MKIKQKKDEIFISKVDCNECPFLLRKIYKTSFPLLRTLAKKYCASPGTSEPSERVFMFLVVMAQ